MILIIKLADKILLVNFSSGFLKENLFFSVFYGGHLYMLVLGSYGLRGTTEFFKINAGLQMRSFSLLYGLSRNG